MHLGSPLSMKHIFTHPGEFRDSRLINLSKRLGVRAAGCEQMGREGRFQAGYAKPQPIDTLHAFEKRRLAMRKPGSSASRRRKSLQDQLPAFGLDLEILRPQVAVCLCNEAIPPRTPHMPAQMRIFAYKLRRCGCTIVPE